MYKVKAKNKINCLRYMVTQVNIQVSMLNYMVFTFFQPILGKFTLKLSNRDEVHIEE